jgi:uncharacterized membrane protein
MDEYELVKIKEKLAPVKNEEKIGLSSNDINKAASDDIDNATRLVELDLRKEFLKGNIQDREERKNFANKIFKLLTVFLATIVLVVICAGFSKRIGFELSDTILIALLTTTTANIIGIFLFVVKYIFKANICHHCGRYIIDSKAKD